MKKKILVVRFVLSTLVLLSVLVHSTNAQERNITGIIADSTTGSPLIGVTVQVKGNSTGTTTDTNGQFSIDVPNDAVLEVSYVGYQPKTVAINGRNSLSILLQPSAKGLNEVVVVGYGKQKKVNLTGSVAVVNSEALENRPATSVTSLLQGKMSGVNITQTSGRPGLEGSNVLIRGLGTMNNAQPLIIIDGMEGTLDDVNPNDIASISVLKDAAAASIYGSRSANGVILVTTKMGQTGASKITYNMYFGTQKATSLPQYLSSAGYARLYNEGLKNEGRPAAYSDEDINKYASGEDPYNYPNTDWLDLFLRGSGFTQNHNLTFSGGNDKTHHLISFGYYQQNGLVEKSNSKRYNFRINLDSKVTEWFKMGINAALSRRNITSPQGNYDGGGLDQFFKLANRIPPTYVNRYEDGSWGDYIGSNPIAWIADGGLVESKYSHLLGSTFGEVKLAKNLTLKGVMGIDYSVDDGKTHIKSIAYHNGSVQGPNSVSDYLGRKQNITLKALLTYEKTFKKNSFKILLGTSRESFQSSVDKGYRKNFPSNSLNQLDAGSSNGWSNSGNATQFRMGSYFGRINYIYDEKYLFEANLRRDGSSKFANGNQWGVFPSFSAGWRLSEEQFLNDISWLNNLKLRGSWGKLGNNRISDYQYISTITLGQNYNFGGVVADGAATTVANNPDITWETTTELDIGIDVDMFKVFSITADYYNRYTNDILTTVPVSQAFGLPAPVVNAGAMRNSGFELQLGYNNNIGSFRYNVSLNGAYNTNIVKKYKNPSKGDNVYMEGVSWAAFYGYKAIGIFQTDEEAASSPHPVGAPVKAGDLKFKDINEDGKIDGNDRIVLGNTIPKITYGLTVDLTYKGIDFSAFFQGVDKVNRTLSPQSEWPFYNGGKIREGHLDRTIVENGKVTQQGYYPRILINQTQNQVMSSFLVLSSSYLRMKNVSIGYTLPESWIQKAYISKARIYFSGENLLTFTKFPKVADPEVASGYSYYSYPQVKFYTCGISLTF